MSNMFSTQLMKKAKIVLEEKSGRVLSDDEIEIMLDRLSQLGMFFVKNVLDNKTKIKKYEINSEKI
ncbi:MAG: hypothetical protein US25_C0017G0008 [Candidatus Moranbacteria bacterium GW2011_GWE1_36_7]|nr:MAG: hypothetical protein UR99_C0025G0008 [Candidatus Moranbacteria bacterium GW2011_GWD2_36_12]KKQ06058.1 MAG: hypothetical protein US16_C0026G0008 [Candidatus Moranbacteria bacterium GW2011_GWE2_36_40]KKQ14910.1 MAG: hypothetical protein US25_C0017G0008 [Candidatus Moranbacteria bacterium GW2011_GWE1_36_7]